LTQSKKNNTKGRCLKATANTQGRNYQRSGRGQKFSDSRAGWEEIGIQIIQKTEETRVQKGKLDAIEHFKSKERYRYKIRLHSSGVRGKSL
jgi:hypothetical protein